MKKIEFLDLAAQYKTIKNEIDAAIQRVLDSGVFIGGKEVDDFEKEMAAFHKVKYVISLNSGTDALFLSLKALGIGSGDEVITTPFTFIATAAAIMHAGANPVFADIEGSSFTIDPREVERRITKRTRAIIPVHLFGQMAKMGSLMELAKEHKLFVIEDAAQAIGASYRGKRAGTIGDTGCFSFFPAKNLGAYGDGGMVVTNSRKLANFIRLLKNHGSLPINKYKNIIWGINSRLDSLQAAILKVKMKHLAKRNKDQIKRAIYYTKHLKDIKGLIPPTVTLGTIHVFHQYTIRARKRDSLRSFLEKEGVPSMIYYPTPLHLQPALASLGYKKGDFPNAEKASQEVLSLPIYPEIKREDQDYIIQKIKFLCAI